MYVGRDTVATPGAYLTNETNNRYDVFFLGSPSDHLPIKNEDLSSLDKVRYGMLRYGTGIRYGTYMYCMNTLP